MSRSGTSAVCRTLVASGFSAGSDQALLPADVHNPIGYFESMSMIALNHAILDELDATWYQPPSPEAQREANESARRRLRTALEDRLSEAGEQPLALKDPRIGVMLELWGPLLTGRLHPVLVVRHPLEVALSLARRDGMPIPFGLAAWELHMTGVIDTLRDPVTVTHYAQLCATPQTAVEFVEAVARTLSPTQAAHVDAERARGAVEARFHRNRAGAADDDFLTPRQRRLWQWLQALPAGTQLLVPPSSLLARGERPAAVLVQAARASKQAEALIAQLQQQIEAQEKLLGAAEREQQRLRALVRSEQARLQAEISRLTALLQSEQQRLASELRDHQVTVQHLTHELDAVRQHANRGVPD